MPNSYMTSTWYPTISETNISNLTLVQELSYPGGVPPKDINEFLKMALTDKSIGFYNHYV